MIRDLTNLNNHFTVEYARAVVDERKIVKKRSRTRHHKFTK